MSNLRALAVTDMREQNLKDWYLPVQFTDPDGNVYNKDNISGEQLQAVQILYSYPKMDPQTGEEILINEPVVVMARKSLARVPVAGERWHLRFPTEPDPTIPAAQWGDYVLSELRAPEVGESLGFIRLYPQKAVQS